MKRILAVLAICLIGLSSVAEAKGGFSGGGGRSFGGGGFSSGRSFSSGSSFSGSKSYSAPSSPNKGGFSSSSRPSTTTTTTTTRSSSFRSSSGRSYGGGYVHPGMMYGGWGMGYGYSNGLLTGMIIANMMHPQGTVMYNGGGSYNNNALLYPDGRVVNQQGYQVGTYQNGQFTAMDNGPMVAQQVPNDAIQQPAVQPQPVIIQQSGISTGDCILIGILMFIMFFCLLGALV